MATHVGAPLAALSIYHPNNESISAARKDFDINSIQCPCPALVVVVVVVVVVMASTRLGQD